MRGAITCNCSVQIRHLETENDNLRAEIELLRDSLGERFEAPIEWGLTSSQTRILGVLLARGFASRDMLMAVLYGDKAGREPDTKIVDIFVCKLRRKLEPLGIEILTRWGRGYDMTPEMRALTRSLVTRQAA